MNLASIIHSEVRKINTNTIYEYTYIWNLEKWY